jgi:ComF family protein
LGTYEGLLRKAIHSFKYDKKSMLANPLGKLLSEYGSRLLNKEEYNLIIPVPLHPQRLRQRGFNQSLMLAKKISEAWHVKVCAECLKRIKWTIPQTMLPVNERQINVKGAFSCSDSAVRGKKVLLVDDVYTSGSTVNECAKVLKKHGVLQVDVLILARTI